MMPLGQEPPSPEPSLPNAGAGNANASAFWSYMDVLVFAGLAVPSLLLGDLIVRLVVALFHWHARFRVAEALPAQFLGYLILFGLLAAAVTHGIRAAVLEVARLAPDAIGRRWGSCYAASPPRSGWRGSGRTFGCRTAVRP